jgi:cysteine sulfinate desulfinase/cysteine desulfurase-like protein
MAMGVPEELAVCALRFSFGHTTTSEEIDRALTAIGECVRAVRTAAAGMRA